MKKIEILLYDELSGLGVRFEDKDYYVSPKERQVMNQFVDLLIFEARQNGYVSFEDFHILVHMIERLESTWKKDILGIAYDIYGKMELLNFRKEDEPKNFEKRIENSLIELDEILDTDDSNDILRLRMENFLYEMYNIIVEDFGIQAFNYTDEVLRRIHMKKEQNDCRWLNACEQKINYSSLINKKRFLMSLDRN